MDKSGYKYTYFHILYMYVICFRKSIYCPNKMDSKNSVKFYSGWSIDMDYKFDWSNLGISYWIKFIYIYISWCVRHTRSDIFNHNKISGNIKRGSNGTFSMLPLPKICCFRLPPNKVYEYLRGWRP